MKAVILAAGASRRLYPLTLEKPKCLLDIGEKTLLAHQLECLAACFVQEVVLVVGYLSGLVRQAVSDTKMRLPVRIVENPDYAETNNLYSLWTARELLRDHSFVCLHADLLFHPEILRICLAQDLDICVAIDRRIHEETMKVSIDHAGSITRIDKNIPERMVSGTFLGLAAFSTVAAGMLLDEAETLVEAGNNEVYFTAAINGLIQKGIAVGYSTTKRFPWIEIDFPEELNQARAVIYPAITGADPENASI